MKISREARRTARGLLQLSLVHGHVDAVRVTEISDKLITDKPRSYIQILKEFTRLVRLELEKRSASVESAVELDAADKEQIGAWLQGNAADTGTTRHGSKIAKKLHGDTPVRITESRWFIHKHDDVSQGSIAKAQGLKNCAACHADAQRGVFSR